MPWYSVLLTNAQLVRSLQEDGVIGSNQVIAAMSEVDRGDYTSSELPYVDNPSYIGYGQTISAPHIHGRALEVVLPLIRIYKLCFVTALVSYRSSSRVIPNQELKFLTWGLEVDTFLPVLQK